MSSMCYEYYTQIFILGAVTLYKSNIDMFKIVLAKTLLFKPKHKFILIFEQKKNTR